MQILIKLGILFTALAVFPTASLGATQVYGWHVMAEGVAHGTNPFVSLTKDTIGNPNKLGVYSRSHRHTQYVSWVVSCKHSGFSKTRSGSYAVSRGRHLVRVPITVKQPRLCNLHASGYLSDYGTIHLKLVRLP